MLDYGDLNEAFATEHEVSLVAFDATGSIVDIDTLAFSSDGSITPEDLILAGDALSAEPGQPGNYTFNVEGAGIASVELQFSSNVGTGPTDPNFALAVLCFDPDLPDIPDTPIASQCAYFDVLEPGSPVEGLGTVHPYLNISSTGNAIVLAEGVDPFIYGAPNIPEDMITNGGIVDGGFADAEKLHEYSFSFSPGLTVNLFSLQMLDYGDLNEAFATEHEVTLVAYDSGGNLVGSDTLAFSSDGTITPPALVITGDALTAAPGEPGNYVFSVAGNNISQLELQFSSDVGSGPTDPNFALAVLCFEPEFPESTPGSQCADFATLEPGSPVEGLGTVHPDLNIITTGNAIVLAEGVDPFIYGAPNIPEEMITNGGIVEGGFADAEQLHDYSFSFAPGLTVEEFSLQLLDYGDLNTVFATEHEVSLVAYDGSGNVVDTNVLAFSSDGTITPPPLVLAGDAISSVPGEPGNYVFSVAGNGIERIELEFSSNLGSGFTDPNFALALLCFEPEEQIEPELDPPTADLTLLRSKRAPEIGGKFLVEYACSATAPNLVSATINGYDVVNGQEVNLVVRENESARVIDDMLIWLFAPDFSFDVTCADDNGNEVSTTIVPEFETP
ncbi:MAG: hypothetical protein CL608_07190 [Anaerolineaceae bacterium]|nr:hypothetical protein [Anaerolineaceae bacterium]